MTRFDVDVAAAHSPSDGEEADGLDLISLLLPARCHWKTVVIVGVFGGALAVGTSFLVKPRFMAENTFLPPRSSQGGTSGALASLGALSGLALGSGSTRGSPDEYIALMQSVTISDRILKRFGLQKEWDERYVEDARLRLSKMVSISAGKKDGLMHVQVTDIDPKRAAQIANQYVDELRAMTNVLAVSEAQQRRVFFEHLLEQTRDKLAETQSALEASGYTAGALNAEPRTAAEAYARTRAELTAAEVRLQVLRSTLADSSVEVRTQQQTVSALHGQLQKLEAQGQSGGKTGDYINRYRDYKYQEALFDLFAKQYEAARVDESREGAIQVVDAAAPPEKKASPKRTTFGIAGFFIGLLLGAAYFVRRDLIRKTAT